MASAKDDDEKREARIAQRTDARCLAHMKFTREGDRSHGKLRVMP